MPKSDKQKLKLLYLKEIFERDTNETHGITMEYILDELQRQGIKAERKSIYSDLYYLEQYGMEIQHAAGKEKPIAFWNATKTASKCRKSR